MFRDRSDERRFVKKVVRPAQKREATHQMNTKHGLSIWQACTLTGLHRSSYYYRSNKQDDTELIEALNRLAVEHPSYGFRKMYHSLRHQGYLWNHKRVRRVYRKLGLNLTRKRKRRLPHRERHPLNIPLQINQTWSMDFMSDALWNNRRFRTLNIIDDFNREVIWIEVSMSIGAKHLTELLDWLVKERGKPKAIRVDNGPEFISSTFTHWCHNKRIALLYIQPGKPIQNALIERFNRSYRSEVLDCHLFESIVEVRNKTIKWIDHYNNKRPHESLNNLSPIKYAETSPTHGLGILNHHNKNKSISLKV